MTQYICYGHCFLEFPDAQTFNEHADKVARQRALRRRRYLYNKLKREFDVQTT